MKSILHKAETRGHANHGWLDTYHTFSFAGYRDPERMHFGVLRVLNDDTVAPGRGFGMHPHDNMEIITIPLEGDLQHRDSMGNGAVIRQGDVQVMSAGTGIRHSEFNASETEEVRLLQIWVFPREKNVEPRYDQVSIRELSRKDAFYQIVSPDPGDKGVWIHQDAWFHLGDFNSGGEESYRVKKEGNGIYLFILEGSVEVNGTEMYRRDGMGIWDVPEIRIIPAEHSRVLLMDLPMSV